MDHHGPCERRIVRSTPMAVPAVSTDLFDPFGPAALDDPYPFYAQLRRLAPVAHLDDHGIWMLARYDDVVRAWRDPAGFSSVRGMGVAYPRFLGGSEPAGSSRSLLVLDPPVHTRLRRLLAPAFAPPAVAELEPEVRQLCALLVDGVLARPPGAQDLVRHLAELAPMAVIARLLDVPGDRIDDVRRWTTDLRTTRTGAQTGAAPTDPAARQQARAEVRAHVAGVMADRAGQPGHDLLGRLIHGAHLAGDELDEDDLVGFVTVLLAAGHETTANLLSNLLLVLIREPRWLDTLRASPALIPATVDEALRFDPPVQGLFRWTTGSVRFGDVVIPANSAVWGLFGSAGRDESRFERPDEFDPTRTGTADHVSFGHGAHACLGAPLARLIARVALEVLLARTSGIELAGTPQRSANPVFRGLASLPVALTAASAGGGRQPVAA